VANGSWKFPLELQSLLPRQVHALDHRRRDVLARQPRPRDLEGRLRNGARDFFIGALPRQAPALRFQNTRMGAVPTCR
jgi:hypothetical protein